MITSVVGFLSLPHELLHYAAARLLGVDAYIQGNVTWVRKTTVWKSTVISLAPVCAGIVALCFCIGAFVQPGADQAFWLLLICAAVAWLIGCALDIRDVWRLARSQ